MEIRFCPRCRASIARGARFCYQCGTDLERVAAVGEQISQPPLEARPARPPIPIAPQGLRIEQLDPINQARALAAYTAGVKHIGHRRLKSGIAYLARAAALAPGDERVATALVQARERHQGAVNGSAVALNSALLASPGRRAGALTIDLFIWVVIASAAIAIVNAALGDANTARERDLQDAAGAACLFLSYVLYFWPGNALGQSIGGKAAGCRVVEQWTLGRPGAWRGLVRAFLSIASTPLLLAGWLWAIWDPQQQTWHDKVAGTYVLNARAEEPAASAWFPSSSGS